MEVALIEKANTSNITIVNEGNYRLNLPDGSQVSPVEAGWENETWMLPEIDFDSPLPTYLYGITAVTNTGTGYTANDIVTVSGGTATGNVGQLRVYSVGSNGIVTGLLVSNSGFYTTDPVSNNAPTGGTGTGLRANLDFPTYPVSSKTYIYNANTDMAVETNVYQTPVIDNTYSIELQRQAAITADTGNQGLKDRLKTATPAQIDAWLLSNVTNLAEARAVLGSIIKFLANNIARLDPQ